MQCNFFEFDGASDFLLESCNEAYPCFWHLRTLIPILRIDALHSAKLAGGQRTQSRETVVWGHRRRNGVARPEPEAPSRSEQVLTVLDLEPSKTLNPPLETIPPMSDKQKLIKARIGLLEPTQELGKTKAACQSPGISRSHIYEIKEACEY